MTPSFQELEIIEKAFSKKGGEFVSEILTIAEKWKKSRCFLFDWDGVFNNGIKTQSKEGSPFSEADSMGLNLLRFGHWMSHGEQQPLVGIMSGERNESAIHFAQREHLHYIYLSWKNKSDALDKLSEQYGVKPDEIVFVFDDVLDLSAAGRCSLNILTCRSASPLFTRYVKEKHYADYITGQEGGHHAIRECCELLLGIAGLYNLVVKERIDFSERYQRYFEERNRIETEEWPFGNS